MTRSDFALPSRLTFPVTAEHIANACDGCGTIAQTQGPSTPPHGWRRRVDSGTVRELALRGVRDGRTLMTETTEVLRRARALVERGWCQGVDQQGDCYCLRGAIFQASSTTREIDSAFDVIRLAIAPPSGLVTAWNDEPGRTQAEVLAAFDAAIAMADAAGTEAGRE